MKGFIISFIFSLCFIIAAERHCSSYSWPVADLMVTDPLSLGYPQHNADVVNFGINNLVVGYTDDRIPGESRIRVSLSTDGGMTFQDSAELDPYCFTGCQTSNVQFAYDSSQAKIYAVYEKKFLTSYQHIYVSSSQNGGTTWSMPVLVNDDGDYCDHSAPCIAINPIDQGIHVAWNDKRSGNTDIYYAHSTDGGATFSVNLKINPWTDGAALDYDPDIIISQVSNVHIAYISNFQSVHARLYLATSDNNGDTFFTNNLVSDDGNAQAMPKLAVSRFLPFVHIFWVESLSVLQKVKCCTTADFGLHFSTPIFVSHNMYAAANNPQPAVDNFGDVFCAWDDTRNGDTDIYFSSSSNMAMTFSDDLKISHSSNATNQLNPALAVNPLRQSLYVVWDDLRFGGLSHIMCNNSQPSLYDGFTEPTFSQWSFASGVRRSAEHAIDGDGFCCQLGIPSAGSKTTGHLEQNYPAYQQGTVDFWFYDGYGSDPVYESSDFSFEIRSNTGKAGVVRALGVVNVNNKEHYQAYDGSSWNVIWVIPRSEGWHRGLVTVDDTGIKIEVDAADYPLIQPVYSDSSFNRFIEFEFIAGTDTGPYYIDSVNVNSVSLMSIPALNWTGLVILFLALSFGLRRLSIR